MTETGTGTGRRRVRIAAPYRLPRVLLGLSPSVKALSARAGMIARFWQVEVRTKAAVPLMVSRAICGFPSPADDYIDRFLDFNELLASNPEATFTVECEGDSMTGVGIFPGDFCIVDKALTANDGDIIVGVLDGDFTIKTYRRRGNDHWLQPENPAYRDIMLTEGMNFEVWGVVAFSIGRQRHRR